MDSKQLYDAMAKIDESYISEAENTSKTKKKYGVFANNLLPSALCLVAVAAVVCGAVYVHQSNRVHKVDDPQSWINEHGGDGDGEPVEQPTFAVPDELLVSANLCGDVHVLKGLFPDDFDEDADAAEMDERRTKQLLAFRALLNEDAREIDFDTVPMVPFFETDSAKITGYSNHISVSHGLFVTRDATNDQVTEALKNDRYAAALMAYIGLDKDTLFVYRETVLLGSEVEGQNVVVTYYTVCNKASTPQDQALNMSSQYLRFWVREEQNTVSVSPLYGYFEFESKTETLTDGLTYTDALAVCRLYEPGFKVDNLLSCTVTYVTTQVKGSALPCYKFCYAKESGNATVVVPMVNDGKTLFH